MDFTIKIEIDLSDSTKKYLDGILAGRAFAPTKSEPAAITKPAATPPPAAITKPAATPPPAATTKPATTPPPAPTAKQTVTTGAEGEIGIEALRKLLGAKVNDNREAVRAELQSLNASSISTLDVSHYKTLYNFLNKL